MRNGTPVPVLILAALALVTLGFAATSPDDERIDTGKHLTIAIGDSITRGDTFFGIGDHKNTIRECEQEKEAAFSQRPIR